MLHRFVNKEIHKYILACILGWYTFLRLTAKLTSSIVCKVLFVSKSLIYISSDEYSRPSTRASPQMAAPTTRLVSEQNTLIVGAVADILCNPCFGYMQYFKLGYYQYEVRFSSKINY